MSEEYVYTLGVPKISTSDDTYVYTWHDGDDLAARVTVQGMYDKGGELKAEVSVYWLLGASPNTRPIAGPASVNLLAAGGGSGYNAMGRHAEEMAPGVTWKEALQKVKVDAIHRYREGEPSTRLGTNPDRQFETPFLIRPFVASSGTSVLYGEGGLAKSTLALLAAISVASGMPIFGERPTVVGPVVYFDYEDDETIHDIRMLAACRSLGLNPTELEIYHVPLIAKVSQAISIMKRRALEHDSTFNVLDSVGMGRGGDAASAEDTIRLFRALRSLRRPNLAVDHISHESRKRKGLDVAAFGSVYTMNSARLAWSFGKSDGPDPDVIYLHARNTKVNHTKRAEDQSFELRFRNDNNHMPHFIELTRTEGPRVASGVTVSDRMQALLIGEPEGNGIQEIADRLGVSRSSVDNTLARDTTLFARIQGVSPVRVRLRDANPFKKGENP